MSEELISLDHYSYSFDESISSYSFSTEKGAVYRIAFTNDYTFNSISSNEEFENQYQLIVERVSDNKVAHDPKIAATINSIIIQFFKTKKNTLLYICSEEDGKEEFRFKAFNKWYNKSRAKDYILKEDRILEVDFKGQTTLYYTSFLYHIDNPNRERLLEVYDKIQETINK